MGAWLQTTEANTVSVQPIIKWVIPMRRAEFVKLIKAAESYNRIQNALDHPDVIDVLRRHDMAIAQRRAEKLQREPTSAKVRTKSRRSKPESSSAE